MVPCLGFSLDDGSPPTGGEQARPLRPRCRVYLQVRFGVRVWVYEDVGLGVHDMTCPRVQELPKLQVEIREQFKSEAGNFSDKPRT